MLISSAKIFPEEAFEITLFEHKPVPIRSCSKKRVRFSNIEIRLYNLTLGDHPECRSGPPTSLSWDYVLKNRIDVETHEKQMASSRRQRKSQRMSPTSRENMLKEAGFSRAEQYKAIVNARKTRTRRIHSNDFARLHLFTFNMKVALKSTVTNIK